MRRLSLEGDPSSSSSSSGNANVVAPSLPQPIYEVFSISQLDQLLKSGEVKDINAVDRLGWTHLHRLAKGGHVSCMHLLLELDIPADPNKINTDGNTPLHIAVMNGHLDALEVLLLYGADRNVRNNLGKTPSDLAINNTAILGALCNLDLESSSSASQIRRLMSITPSSSSREEMAIKSLRMSNRVIYNNIFEIFCRIDNVVAIQKYMDDCSLSDPDLEGSNGMTNMMNACFLGQVEVMKFLVQSPNSVWLDKPDHFGNRAIHYAVNGNRCEAVRYLIMQGADVSLINANNDSAVDLAHRFKHNDIIELFEQFEDTSSTRRTLQTKFVQMNKFSNKKVDLCAILQRELKVRYASRIAAIASFFEKTCSLRETESNNTAELLVIDFGIVTLASMQRYSQSGKLEEILVDRIGTSRNSWGLIASGLTTSLDASTYASIYGNSSTSSSLAISKKNDGPNETINPPSLAASISSIFKFRVSSAIAPLDASVSMGATSSSGNSGGGGGGRMSK